jgi:hypothetical protein
MKLPTRPVRLRCRDVARARRATRNRGNSRVSKQGSENTCPSLPRTSRMVALGFVPVSEMDTTAKLTGKSSSTFAKLSLAPQSSPRKQMVNAQPASAQDLEREKGSLDRRLPRSARRQAHPYFRAQGRRRRVSRDHQGERAPGRPHRAEQDVTAARC